MEEITKSNIKTLKTHCETTYDKPEEHILNIVVQGSDNKILLIKIVLFTSFYVFVFRLFFVVLFSAAAFHKDVQGGPKKRGHSVLQKYCSDLHDFFCRNQSRLILNTKT